MKILDCYNLTELRPFDLMYINGGGFWTWLGAVAGVVALVGLAIGSGPLVIAGILVSCTAAIAAYYHNQNM